LANQKPAVPSSDSLSSLKVGLSQSLSILPELFKCKAAFNLIKDVVDTIPTVVSSPSLSAAVLQKQR